MTVETSVSIWLKNTPLSTLHTLNNKITVYSCWISNFIALSLSWRTLYVIFQEEQNFWVIRLMKKSILNFKTFDSAIQTELEWWMRTSLFWVITQNYPLRNNPEESSSLLLRGGSLKSNRESWIFETPVLGPCKSR